MVGIEKQSLYTLKVNNDESPIGEFTHVQILSFGPQKARRYAVHTGHKPLKMASIEFDEYLINLW